MDNKIADLLEEIHLRTEEKKLLAHDPEINNIIQKRLETGEWTISSRGFLLRLK